VLTELKRANQTLDAALADFDPEVVSSAQAAQVYEQAARLVRRGEAIMVLAAGRAAESRLWKETGHRSAAEWMAQAAGTGVGEALAQLETGSRLGWLAATEDALRRGELSAPQVQEITAAALHRPKAEAELL
jgi:Domain of unknown function (DUF222)